MSRRNVGIGSLAKSNQSKINFNNLSNTLSSQQLSNLQTQLNTFKTSLENFSINHKKDIEDNLEFRNQFTLMCAQIGVDPLSTPKPGSIQGMWSELLGLSDFYTSLAVQIVDICLSSKDLNGGLVNLEDLRRILTYKRKSNISNNDIDKAVKILEPLNGKSYEILKLDSNNLFLRSVPKEMDTDQTVLLSLASHNDGWVTGNMVKNKSDNGNGYTWNDERVKHCLHQAVMDDGIAWIDTQSTEVTYWFPALVSSIQT